MAAPTPRKPDSGHPDSGHPGPGESASPETGSPGTASLETGSRTPVPRSGAAASLFGRLPLPERTYLTDALRTETVGGLLLLVAAIAALVWANTPLADSYETVRDAHLGPSALGLDLSVQHWAADGLLTVFFFVAGIELKRELVAGELRDPRAAALPVVAAVCGMAVPALVYVLTNTLGGGALGGWAVPTATDIAFALAVLAVIGTSLPSALRAFLLTLAVVDDLFAILIIAVFFTSGLNFAALGGAVAGLVLFRLLLRAGVRGWYVYVPLALVNWALMYNSGVHATIAGVTMGLMLRCHRRDGEAHSPGERVEHLVRPFSAGLAVPLFALFSAGVPVTGGALAEVFTEPETLGVVLGLVVGKTVGVFGGTWLAARFTRASLNEDLDWGDVLALAALAGIGFTVSLLIGELAFAADPGTTAEVKAAVLTGSLIAAVIATVLLRLRVRKYRALYEEEERDEDHSGVPDIYEQDDPAHHRRMAALYEAKAAAHRKLAEAAERDRPADAVEVTEAAAQAAKATEAVGRGERAERAGGAERAEGAEAAGAPHDDGGRPA